MKERIQPQRPALRYYGGKWRLAPWIISKFPIHTCYVEPFCGAASVFLRKQPSEFEVINDLDEEVVNFFRVLRERTEEFTEAIARTPYSRREYDIAWEVASDEFERARRYYVRAWQGWGGGKGSRPSGWRYQHSNNRGKSVVKDWNTIDHLFVIAERLKSAFIENDNAFNIIKRYDQQETFFYLDPPYLSDTRSGRWKDSAYRHELSKQDHETLLDILKEIEGMAIISGYPSSLYTSKLGNWRMLKKSSRTTNPEKQAQEVIWISPKALEMRHQKRLF